MCVCVCKGVCVCVRGCVFVCFLVIFHTRDVKNVLQRMADVCFELYVSLLISLLDDQQVKITMYQQVKINMYVSAG